MSKDYAGGWRPKIGTKGQCSLFGWMIAQPHCWEQSGEVGLGDWVFRSLRSPGKSRVGPSSGLSNAWPNDLTGKTFFRIPCTYKKGNIISVNHSSKYYYCCDNNSAHAFVIFDAAAKGATSLRERPASAIKMQEVSKFEWYAE